MTRSKSVMAASVASVAAFGGLGSWSGLMQGTGTGIFTTCGKGCVVTQPEIKTMAAHERIGYSNFLSLVWMLFKANREAKRLGMQVRLDITLPTSWGQSAALYRDQPAQP